MSDYIPYQEEWEVEVLKLSKINIVKLMRNIGVERDELQQENQRLKDALDEIIKQINSLGYYDLGKACESLESIKQIAQKAKEEK
jgi:hypothetical protein